MNTPVIIDDQNFSYDILKMKSHLHQPDFEADVKWQCSAVDYNREETFSERT